MKAELDKLRVAIPSDMHRAPYRVTTHYDFVLIHLPELERKLMNGLLIQSHH